MIQLRDTLHICILLNLDFQLRSTSTSTWLMPLGILPTAPAAFRALRAINGGGVRLVVRNAVARIAVQSAKPRDSRGKGPAKLMKELIRFPWGWPRVIQWSSYPLVNSHMSMVNHPKIMDC